MVEISEESPKFCSREEGVRGSGKFMTVGFPALASCCDLRDQDKLPRNREEADLILCSVTPLQKCETRTNSLFHKSQAALL